MSVTRNPSRRNTVLASDRPQCSNWKGSSIPQCQGLSYPPHPPPHSPPLPSCKSHRASVSATHHYAAASKWASSLGDQLIILAPVNPQPNRPSKLPKGLIPLSQLHHCSPLSLCSSFCFFFFSFSFQLFPYSSLPVSTCPPPSLGPRISAGSHPAPHPPSPPSRHGSQSPFLPHCCLEVLKSAQWTLPQGSSLFWFSSRVLLPAQYMQLAPQV